VKEISFEEILEIVSEVTEMDSEIITGRSQKLPVLRARHLLSVFAFEYGYTKKGIGRKLGRDHSTIISGIKRMKGEIDIYKNNSFHVVTSWENEIDEKIKDLLAEKIIFAALEEERRIQNAS
jgi:chromosomal replication initiation ATPase DnaA